MQHIIWEMFKIPFLILAFFVGLAIWIAILGGIVAFVRWVRSNPYKEVTPEERQQNNAKKDFFDEQR